MDPANAEAYRFLGLALYAELITMPRGTLSTKSLAPNPLIHQPMPTSTSTSESRNRGAGDLRRAAIAYRHALSLRPDFWEAHSNLGVVLHDQGKLDEAIAEYRAAKRQNPEDASIRNNLGNTLCDKQDFAGAIAEFENLYRQIRIGMAATIAWPAPTCQKRLSSAIRELQRRHRRQPRRRSGTARPGSGPVLSGKDQEALGVLRKQSRSIPNPAWVIIFSEPHWSILNNGGGRKRISRGPSAGAERPRITILWPPA